MLTKRKTAVITGASRGIGRQIALTFARAKFNVVIGDVLAKDLAQAEKEIKKTGAKCLAAVCDVSNKKQVDELMSQAVKKFKKIDVLVNNAGIFPFVNFTEMSEADWDKVLDVDLKGVFLCSQAALKVMPDGGRIVNISSIASLVGFAGLTHYCAAKSGINGLIRALALELAPRRITVNNIAPGAIETPGATQVMTEELKQQTTANIPLGRFGQPQDIANAVFFLASDQADYITGQTIAVDGGWTLR